VLTTHWPALDARALVFDDQEYLVSNHLVTRPSLSSAGRFFTEVTKPSTVRGYYQPLTMISLMVDCALGGSPQNLTPFHRTSLALHTANTLLVLLLLYLLFEHWWAAALVALLFGVHPLTVEPIPWVGERKTLLAAFFALLSLVCYVLQARRTRAVTAPAPANVPPHQADKHAHLTHEHGHAHKKHEHANASAPRRSAHAKGPTGRPYALYAGCILAYFLAVLSKPTATPLPLVMILLDFWPLGRLSIRSILAKTPLLAIGALSAVITFVSQNATASTFDPGHLSRFRPLFNVCYNLVFYPAKMIWPANLSPHYPFPEPFDLTNLHVLAGIVGTLVLVAGVLLSLRKTRACLAGAMIFVLVLLPTAGIVGFTNVVASDKYAYLPAIGVLLVLAALAKRLWDSPSATKALPIRIAMVAATASAAFAFACVSRHDLQHWRDTKTLYDHTLALAPNSYVLHHNYGVVLHDEGRRLAAIGKYRRAIELNPKYADTHYNLGIVLQEDGQREQAVQEFQRALELNPRDAKSHNSLGNVFAELGRADDALREYQEAVQNDADLTIAHTNLGNLLLTTGRVDEAIAEYRLAARGNANCAGVHANLGTALLSKGAIDEAIEEYRIALKHKPGVARCENNLGLALAKKGSQEEAISHYREALRVQAAYPDAFTNMGVALTKLGRSTDAADAFRHALQLNPADPKAQSGLVLLTQTHGDASAQPKLAGTALSTHPE
jgi:protein O-mannosyl-transferase